MGYVARAVSLDGWPPATSVQDPSLNRTCGGCRCIAQYMYLGEVARRAWRGIEATPELGRHAGDPLRT